MAGEERGDLHTRRIGVIIWFGKEQKNTNEVLLLMATLTQQLTLPIGARNDFDRDFQSLLRPIPNTESSYATHNLHPYPATFLPHFSSVYIKHFTKEGDLVLDPMCGCGTTVIESCLQKRRSIGVDFDPIGALTSAVAVTPLPISFQDARAVNFDLLRAIRQAMKTMQPQFPAEEDYPNWQMWFREEVMRELLIIRNVIFTFPEPFSGYRALSLLSLSRIVRAVSNADPRDIFPERDKENPIRERKDTFAEFAQSLEEVIRKVSVFTERTHGQRLGLALRSDARRLPVRSNSIRLIVTSPPYAYALDYARVHRLSTLLFVMSNSALLESRKSYIGTDRISQTDPFGPCDGFEFAEEILREVYHQDRKWGLVLLRYFQDMVAVTAELKRVLVRGGRLVYVIGNSTIKGTPFATDSVFLKICEGQRLRVEDVRSRPYYTYRMARKRNTHSNTIKHDTFIMVSKP